MYFYKGVDKDYNYKVGTIDAINQAEAIKKAKEEENILIIVNLSKKSNSELVNNFHSKIIERYVSIENKIKSMRRSTNKSKKKVSEQKISEKSPILKMIKKASSKLPGREIEIVEEEFYSDLQMFKSDSIGSKDFLDTKVTLSKKERRNEEGKSVNWELLNEENMSDEVKSNMKIKVKDKEILMFTRRLQIMISSGVPLLSSLTLLSETSSKNMTKVLNGVLEDIKMGNSFSEAISKYPKQFNSAYVSLVSIGETSGELDDCIKDIIKMKEQEQKVTKKVKTASIYPGIIFSVLSVMMIAASAFFLPKFNEMYEDQDLVIPEFTKIVFGIAGMIPYFAVSIVIIALLIRFSRKRVSKVNQIYVGIRDRLLLNIPIVKQITNALYMYYFSSTTSLMLKNGIRLSDTLSLTGRTINNIYVKNEIEDIGQLMTHGFSFSEAMRDQENFDDILVNVTLTGEESGKMIYSLQKVAEYYDTELNNKVDSMMEIIPPASIIIISIIAAPVIIAAYLPILEMSSGAGLGF